MDHAAAQFDGIRRHCLEIDRCNQRGGRMLSAVDLLEAGTLTRELAAFALAAIGGGASFLVGAMPGGAGKTTVMGALINFVPDDVALMAADGMAAIEQARRTAGRRLCCICHEIGRGPYFAYLWDEELRAYFRLTAVGHMLATNLHADTFEQAEMQICGDNAVSGDDFRRMNLLLFLSVNREGRRLARRVSEAWYGDGRSPHRRVFADTRLCDGAVEAVGREAFDAAMAGIGALVRSDARTIEDVRAAIIAMRRRAGG